MLRSLTTTSTNTASGRLPYPNLTAALSVPFTRKSLTAIRAALTRAAQDYPPTAADPKEGHAAVLIPLCNVNDQPSILLELRGKLRTHSGEVRYGPLCQDRWQMLTTCAQFFTHAAMGAHVCSFPGGKVDPVGIGYQLSGLRCGLRRLFSRTAPG